MPVFEYTAIRASGERYTGTTQAADRFAVYNIVRKEGDSILSVKEQKKGFSFNMNISFSRIKEEDKIVLIRNLAAMLSAGLSLARALLVLERQTKKDKLKNVLHALQEDIQQGIEFAEAMKKYPKVFSPIIISMVRAGEESGQLSETLRTISEQMEKMYVLKKKVKGALIYPAVIVFALFAVGILMMIYIVPTLAGTFRELDADLPASTQVIITLSDLLSNHTLPSLAFLVVMGGLFAAFLRTKLGKKLFELVLLYIPVVGGIVKETNAARTGRTLSSLLSSGVSIVIALDITKDVIQNTRYRTVLSEAALQVEKGSPMSAVFLKHEKLYPSLVGELMAVGEETGKLPDMLMQVALFYEAEVEQKTKNISTIVEPVLMLVVGAAVGFFAMSMIMPIYSISTKI